MKVARGFIFVLFYLFFSISFLCSASNANIDNGGGNMGNGSGGNVWRNEDGVRVTVIRVSDGQSVTTPIDFTNSNVSKVKVNFGKVSKLSYKYGSTLSAKTGKYV